MKSERPSELNLTQRMNSPPTLLKSSALFVLQPAKGDSFCTFPMRFATSLVQITVWAYMGSIGEATYDHVANFENTKN